jgi:D-alanyl-D-alanine carboxypeptidase
VAALLVERLTGEPYGEEIERRILKPLKLNHTSVPGHHPTLPRPHARGYEPVAVDGTVQITDVTDMDPSLDWAAGEMISTTADLDRFLAALLTGKLLSPRSVAEMRRTVEAEPGLFRYGLGLQEFTLPCPTGARTVVGHTGELVGYITVALYDSSGRRLVLALNPYEQEPSLESVLGIAVTAFCPQG